jgi:ADP-dependent NAD(P)H-hydrate dehydratase / NAD(P)H-hydrate epimerase
MIEMNNFDISSIVGIRKPLSHSHKGENGRVLVIGGSQLFHSASLWAAELISHFVDHVFYYSPNSVNRKVLVHNKAHFLNGIVVTGAELEDYIQEADVILIGPGLRRQKIRCSCDYHAYANNIPKIEQIKDEATLSYVLTNALIEKYPLKKWVVDAGALQEIEYVNITSTSILTPHQQELFRLFPSIRTQNITKELFLDHVTSVLRNYSATWLLKRQGTDFVVAVDGSVTQIEGGNEGLTKGGTGDLLAALISVLYVFNNPPLATSVASYMLKKTAEFLYKTKGPYFTTSELMTEIPHVFWELSQNPSVRL